MPRVIDAPTEERIELAELVELLETGGFDSQDEDNFASWGPQLRKLANDRDFLADLMIAELKQRCDGQVRDNQYSAQVMMLHARSRQVHHPRQFLAGAEGQRRPPQRHRPLLLRRAARP